MWGPPHLAFLWQLLHWIRKLDSHLKHAGDGSAKKRSSIQKKLDILLISGKQKRLWPYNVTIFRVKKLPCHTALRTNSNGYFIYYSWSLLHVYTLKQRKDVSLQSIWNMRWYAKHNRNDQIQGWSVGFPKPMAFSICFTRKNPNVPMKQILIS